MTTRLRSSAAVSPPPTASYGQTLPVFARSCARKGTPCPNKPVPLCQQDWPQRKSSSTNYANSAGKRAASSNCRPLPPLNQIGAPSYPPHAWDGKVHR